MGTKMVLHRYSPTTKDWDETLHVIDQTYLDTFGGVDVTLPTGYVYEPNKGLLKVYLNGRRLLSGGQYTEVDDKNIRLVLGVDEEGDPNELQAGDEVYIEVYKNQYHSRGQATVSGTQFYELEKEVRDARKFKEGDTPYPTLDERLDEIQRQLEVVHGGEANVDIQYEYNSRGQVTKEEITGDYAIVRVFTYFEESTHPQLIGEMETETIQYTNQFGDPSSKVVRTYTYDPATRRLLRTAVRGEQA